MFTVGVNLRLETVTLRTHGIEHLTAEFLFNLNDGIFATGKDQLRQITLDLAAIIGSLGDGDGPARELRLVAVTHVAKARPALEGDLAPFFVEARNAEAVRPFFFVGAILWVGIGKHRYFVA